jgi:hypothetical protein
MNPSKKDNILVLIIALCFSFLFYAYYTSTDATVRVQILTAVLAILVTVVNWKYGSSKSSANKDETIRALQEDINKPTVKADTVNAENVENVTTTTTNVNS